MSSVLHSICDFLLGKVDPLPHPFSVVVKQPEDELYDEDPQLEEGFEKGSWGKDEVLVKFDVDESAHSWLLQAKGDKRLKPVPLDKIDLQVIRSWNKERDQKQWILPKNYKMVKPYVIDKEQNWTHEEIAVALNVSKSFVGRCVPRIKEAARLRAKAVAA